MKDIEPYFDKGKPMLKLYKDFQGKLRWQTPDFDLSSKILSGLENLTGTNTNHM